MTIGKQGRHNSAPGCLLSEDMIIEIFLWLPLKSLNRFKRLSKKWYFLISNKDSNFRYNYLSALSTRRRNRNRIVGSHQCDAIMAGFFYQRPVYKVCPDRVRFLPATSTQFKKYFFLPNAQFKKYNIQQGQAQEQGQQGGAIQIINDINPFSSLDESLDKFLSCCQDPDPAAHQKVFIAASSNGFIVCSLECPLECPSPETYYLVNPVTTEWVALPELKSMKMNHVFVGFVCTGDYPSLDLVEYTVVVLSYLVKGKELLFKFFSNGDNQWTEYTCITGYPEPYFLSLKPKVVIVRTATNSDDRGGGIVVYFLVKVLRTMATAIVVFDLNKGDNLLEMIETPGPNLAKSVFECGDFIREFDGVIHYVRIMSCSMDFEFWVLNTESRDWCIKHRASLKPMIEGNLWTNIRLWSGLDVPRQRNEAHVLYHIHAFHPMNPNLIFLTLYGRLVCYNVQNGTLELVYDYSTHNMLEDYYHFVYQWPCWPPLF